MFIRRKKEKKRKEKKKFLEIAVLPKRDYKQIIYRGLCWESMSKIGKTFTIDFQVYAWLAEHCKKTHKKESAFVNQLLNSAKRQDETWTCSICGVSNGNDNATCYVLTDGEFCAGVKA